MSWHFKAGKQENSLSQMETSKNRNAGTWNNRCLLSYKQGRRCQDTWRDEEKKREKFYSGFIYCNCKKVLLNVFLSWIHTGKLFFSELEGRIADCAYRALTQLVERVWGQDRRCQHAGKGTIILFCMLEFQKIYFEDLFYALEGRRGGMK